MLYHLGWLMIVLVFGLIASEPIQAVQMQITVSLIHFMFLHESIHSGSIHDIYDK